MSNRSQHELLTPYDNGESKSRQVEKMFDNIAPAYDKLNHTLSFGIDKLWRRKAIKWLKPFSPKKILDIATGTGDFAIKAYQLLQPEVVTGTDISEGIMELGRKKVKEKGLDNKVIFQKENCLSLSFDDKSFDAATVAFGIRNFEKLETGIREIHRVLKENGRLVILELSVPESFPMKQLYTLYSRIYIPFIGKIVSKDNKAYSYLPESIKAFPQGEMIKQILTEAGFSEVEYDKLTFGICTLYKAKK